MRNITFPALFASIFSQDIVDFLPHLGGIQRIFEIRGDLPALRHEVSPLLKQGKLQLLFPVFLTVDLEQYDTVADRNS